MVRLRDERLRRGMSQNRLAAVSGIPQSDISAIENGRRTAGRGWKQRLADALDVQVESIFPPTDQADTVNT